MLTEGGGSPSAPQGNSIVVPGIASKSYGSKIKVGGPYELITSTCAVASSDPRMFSAMQT